MTDRPIDDDELAAEALAADPEPVVPADAVPFTAGDEALLPDWYMPGAAAGASTASSWRKRIAVGVVTSIGLINAAGLCITYGHVTLG